MPHSSRVKCRPLDATRCSSEQLIYLISSSCLWKPFIKFFPHLAFAAWFSSTLPNTDCTSNKFNNNVSISLAGLHLQCPTPLAGHNRQMRFQFDNWIKVNCIDVTFWSHVELSSSSFSLKSTQYRLVSYIDIHWHFNAIKVDSKKNDPFCRANWS